MEEMYETKSVLTIIFPRSLHPETHPTTHPICVATVMEKSQEQTKTKSIAQTFAGMREQRGVVEKNRNWKKDGSEIHLTNTHQSSTKKEPLSHVTPFR